MRPLVDYLTIRPPLLAVVDPDLRWVERALSDARDALGAEGGPLLSWSITRGWRGSDDLMHRSGLTGVANAKSQFDVVPQLDQLAAWLASAQEVQAQGQPFPFAGGTAILHDLQDLLAKPAVVRLLLDLVDTLQACETMLVFPLPAWLPITHPLASALVQVEAGGDAAERFGSIASALLERFGPDDPTATAQVITMQLAGLTLTAAETAAQLAALDLTAGRGPTGEGALRRALQSAREEVVKTMGVRP